jgi:hypothetical protein
MPKANLKIISITSCVALAAFNALALFPEASDFRVYLTGASLAIALGLLMAILLIRNEKAGPGNRTETARPVPVPVQTAGNREEVEIVSLLAIFQERGRLIDFLMDDITTYDDAQVGAAARVVHQGCKAALEEHFSIRPIREESEGSSVTIPAGYAADEYRLIGKISGPGAFGDTPPSRLENRLGEPSAPRADRPRPASDNCACRSRTEVSCITTAEMAGDPTSPCETDLASCKC